MSGYLADMQLLISCNKRVRFLLGVNYFLSKYACVFLSKERKYDADIEAFRKILNDLGRKPTILTLTILI